MVKRFCLSGGCGVLVEQGYCEQHAKERNHKSNHAPGRAAARAWYNTRQWQTLRALHIDQHPICEHCKAKGVIKQADHVDHKLSRTLCPDRELDGTNLQSLCIKCHAKKSSREQNRGQVLVVCGEPGSGKTTYTEQRARAGDIVFDYDKILATMCSGLNDKADNPTELIPMMQGIRSAVVGWLVSYATHRKVFIIVTDATRAAEIAEQAGGELVRMSGGRAAWTNINGVISMQS